MDDEKADTDKMEVQSVVESGEHKEEEKEPSSSSSENVKTDGGPITAKEEEKEPQQASITEESKGEEKETEAVKALPPVPMDETQDASAGTGEKKEVQKETEADKALPAVPPMDENQGTTAGTGNFGGKNKGGKKGPKQPLATISTSENIPVRASKRIREKPLVQYDNENMEGTKAEQLSTVTEGAKKKKKLALAPPKDKKPPAAGKKKSMTLEEHVAKYTTGHQIVLGN